jgi:hypothetical protein
MQNPDILSLVAASLDYRSLARMLRTSKANAALLTPRFTQVARPHSLGHMVQLIIDERMRTPADEYTARTMEDSCCIRFFNNKNEFGPMAIFTVVEDSHSIIVSTRIGYAMKYPDTEEGFSQILRSHSLTIFPSFDRPLRRGTVSNEEYTNGFEPAAIIQRCPVA